MVRILSETRKWEKFDDDLGEEETRKGGDTFQRQEIEADSNEQEERTQE